MAEDRRILVTNQNVVNIINNFTDDEQIKAAKIEGLSDFMAGGSGDGTGVARHQAGYAASVSSVYGHSIAFSTAYYTFVNPEGDYFVIARGWYGNMGVNVRVVKSPGGIVLYPDYDGANIEWLVLPYYVA